MIRDEDVWPRISQRNLRHIMRRYNAVYAEPHRRWTFTDPSIGWRRHEHYFNVKRP